jgi:3-deoxy-manno-octulosonate cytidylyltransferase (CMP-KDO synthetase)
LPPALLDAVAQCLAQDEQSVMATAAHAISELQDWFNPNVVKVVVDASGRALYFSRAPIPFHRDGLAGLDTGAVSLAVVVLVARPGVMARLSHDDSTGLGGIGGEARARDHAAGLKALRPAAPLRHIGLYAYRGHFLKTYVQMAPSALEGIEALEQLRVLFHGFPMKVLIAPEAPAAGIDTPEDLAAVRLRLGS